MQLNDDSIRRLLQDADAAAPQTAWRGDVAASARRRLARRTSVRRGALACGVLFMAVAILIAVERSRTQIAQKSDAEAHAAARQFAAMSIDADLHELTATKLLSAVSARKAAVDDATTPVADVQMQRDRAALMLVYQANQQANEKRTDLAIAGYQRTIELFPQTHWAKVARQRLHELQI
jgi:hypothetical protein